MSSFVNTVKSKLSGSKGGNANQEPTYSIQPHPAKTNDPADLQPREGLRSGQGAMDAFHARDPFVPTEEIKRNMPQAASRQELQARQKELNRD